jgi:serine/threonine-protein kinase
MIEPERKSLERYAQRSAPLPREEVARIVMQIGDALQTAHSAGVVHGDLKSDTVMYDPESHRIELPDFGIDAARTAAGEQQLRAAGSSSARSVRRPRRLAASPSRRRLTSTAATIAYSLTGRLPYLAKTPREMFTQLLSEPPIPLNQARSDLQFEPPVEA